MKRPLRYARWALRKVKKRVKFLKFKYLFPKITKERILNDLRKLGVSEGDTLFVHSSLSELGFVKNGADAVIDALAEAVGSKGMLMIPCFSISGTMVNTLESGIVFDPKATPTTLGKIPETFRKKPKVVRSIHPTHSVCACGKMANWVVEGHEKCPTTFGRGTPFHKLLNLNGKILGLGVDLGPVTFYHVIEDVEEDFPIYSYCEEEYEATIINHAGQAIVMKVKAHDPTVSKTRIDTLRGKDIRRFFTEYLRNRGFLVEGRIGYARSWLIYAKDLYEAQKELMKLGITIYTTKEQLRKLSAKMILQQAAKQIA